MNRSIGIIAGALFLIVLPFGIASIVRSFHIDFVAFWCAGSATLHGFNPYLEGSLHWCEVSNGLTPSLTLPAPFPPYVMPFLAVFGSLPEPVAYALWTVMVLAAVVLTGAGLSRLTALPATATIAAAASLMLVSGLVSGEMSPVPVCCFVWALVFMRDERGFAAALALGGAALVPNLALGAWLAAFLCVRAVRLPLVAVALVLSAVALAVFGPGVLAAYFLDVLPAESRSEIVGFGQMGTMALLHAARIPLPAATVAAYIIFFAAVAGGIVVGLRLRKRYGGDQWVVAAAAAFGAAFAPLAHGWAVGFILPLAMMVFEIAPTVWAASAVIVLATPWPQMVAVGGVQTVFVLPFLLVLVDRVTRARTLTTVSIAAAIALTSIGLLTRAQGEITPPQAAKQLSLQATPPPTALAQVRWSAFNQAFGDRFNDWPGIVPIYTGYVLLTLAIASAYPGRRVLPASGRAAEPLGKADRP